VDKQLLDKARLAPALVRRAPLCIAPLPRCPPAPVGHITCARGKSRPAPPGLLLLPRMPEGWPCHLVNK